MEITIIKGNIDYINDCEAALVNSELGIRYFSEKGSARKALEEGFAKEEIYMNEKEIIYRAEQLSILAKNMEIY